MLRHPIRWHMQHAQRSLPFLALLNRAAAQHMTTTGGEYRSNAMSFLKRLFPRSPSRQDLERAYLNQAVSLYDLECREREVAHGKFAGF
jgi:hypothetical protein